MKITKKKFLVFLTAILLLSVVGLTLRYLLNYKQNKINRLEKLAIYNRKDIILNLEKEIEFLDSELKKRKFDMIDIPTSKSFDECVNWCKKHYPDHDIVIINELKNKLKTYEDDRIPNSNRKYKSDQVLRGNSRWSNLIKLEGKGLKDRVAYSFFAEGTVLHLAGLKSDELCGLRYKIDQVSEYIRLFILNSFVRYNELCSESKDVFVIPFISCNKNIQPGVDFEGQLFSGKEFGLRAKIGVYKFFLSYKGDGIIVLNKNLS